MNEPLRVDRRSPDEVAAPGERGGAEPPESSFGWFLIVPWVSAAGSLLLGASVLVGWHTRTDALIQVLPDLVPMQYNTALSFLFCGFALALSLREKRFAAMGAALSVILIALGTLVQYGTGANLGLDEVFMRHYLTVKSPDPGRMAPTTALCFLLSGASLCLLVRARAATMLAPAVLSALVAAIGSGTLLGYLTGAETPFGWRAATYMALHTACGFALLGLGIAALSCRLQALRDGRYPRWLPVPVAIALLTLSIGLTQALRFREHREVQSRIAQDARYLAAEIEILLEQRVLALVRLASRWEQQGGTPRDDWLADAALYIAHQRGYAALAWLDATKRLRWLETAEFHDPETARGILSNERNLRPLEGATEDLSGPGFTPSWMEEGGPYMILAVPLHSSRGFDGFVAGLIVHRALFESVFSQPQLRPVLRDYALRIREGDSLLYATSPPGSLDDSGVPALRDAVGARNARWTLELAPTDALIGEVRTPLPAAALFLGFLGAALVTATAHIGLTSSARATEVKALNARLQGELFRKASVSLLREDFSEVDRKLLSLSDSDRDDLPATLEKQPELVQELAHLVRVRDVNDATLQLFDADSKEQFLAGANAILYVGSSLDFREQLSALTSERTRFIAEARLTTIAGRTRHVLFTRSFFDTPDGKTEAILSVLDISDRKQAEEELEESRESLARNLTELDHHYATAPVGLGLIDRDLRFLRINDGLASLGAAPAKRRLGRTIRDVLPSLADQLEPVCRRVLESGEPAVGLELAEPSDAGTTNAWLLHCHPYRLGRAGSDAVSLSVQDVSRIKRAEDVLRQKAEALERANAELAHYAYASSHDLQEPLRTVVSFTTLLARRYRDRLGEEGREFIDYAVEGADRIKGLIEALRVYTDLATDSLSESLIQVDAALDAAVEQLRRPIRKSRAVIYREPLPTVRADAAQLRLLFRHLLDNSLKFADDGRHPSVRIGSRREGGEWIIWIQDDGIGVEEAYREKIFEAFQRLQDRGRYQGSGMGLAICKRIVERHGGRIWVESPSSRGSTFHVALPA